MKKIMKKISSVSACLVLSLSICFTSVGGCYCQAAEVVVAPAVWSLIETLFLSFGITFIVEDSVTKDDDVLVQGMLEQVEAWEEAMQSPEVTARAEELKGFFTNIADYWTGVALSIPETIWDALRSFVSGEIVALQQYYPSNPDINLYGCNVGEFATYLATNVFGVSSKDSKLNTFVENVYNSFVASDYSCLLTFYNPGSVLYCRFVPLSSSLKFGFREKENGNDYCYLYYTDGSLLKSTYALNRNLTYSYCSSTGAKSEEVYSTCFDKPTQYYNYLIVHGQLYDLISVCSRPVNTTLALDFGSVVGLSDFGIPTTPICLGVDAQTLDIVSDVYAHDGYDVITDGRTWDDDENAVVGDVVIPFPGDDLLNAYYNGEITWQELMDALGITVVDTVEEESITGEDIREIIFEETQDILTAIKNLPAVLVDGIAGLFLPSEEFLDDALARINAKLDSFGIAPYDMSGIFDGGDENPFKDIKITIYGQTVTIVSFAYLPMFLDKFRPVIRGLLVLFMIYFTINQLLQLFGLAGIMQTGKKGDE